MLIKRMAAFGFLWMGIALGGCGQNASLPGLEADNAQTPLANGSVLPVPTTTVLTGLTYQLQDIPSGHPSEIRWTTDSQIVFFQLETGISDIEQWGYQLSGASAQKITPDHPWVIQDPLQESPVPLPEIAVDIPGVTELISVSPSGLYALFLSSSFAPTSTPNSVGESTREAFFTDIWLWDHKVAHHLGKIQVCGRKEYKWTTSEDFVIIQKPLDPLTTCDESNFWIINIERGQLYGLMPIETFGPLTSFHSFSPSEDKLLVKQITMPSTQLYLIDLETLSADQLKTPPFVDPVGWLDDDRLLIMHRGEEEEYNSLGFFNLQTEKLDDLLDHDQFTGQYIWGGSLSPNKKWVVFAAAPDPSFALNQSSLWLTQLSPRE